MTQAGSRRKERFLTKGTKDTKHTNRMISGLSEKLVSKRFRISRKDAKTQSHAKRPDVDRKCPRLVISGLAY